LQILDPVQDHALRLCLGAFRTSPSSSLSVLAKEPPLYVRRKISILYSLKLSSHLQNPSYNTVFNSKFKVSFEQKLHQIPHVDIRIQPDLHAVGFLRRNVLKCSIPATPPYVFKRLHIDYSISLSKTTPHQISIEINSLSSVIITMIFFRLYTDGCRLRNQVAAAVVYGSTTKITRLPNTASIFSAELYAISLALTVIRRSKENNFVNFSDSMSSLQALSGF